MREFVKGDREIAPEEIDSELNSELDVIAQRLNIQPDKIEYLRPLSHRFIGVLNDERVKQGKRPLGHNEIVTYVGTICVAYKRNGGRSRESGATYFEQHLYDGALALVTDAGITSRKSLLAYFFHDDHEDHKVPLDDLTMVEVYRDRLLGAADVLDPAIASLREDIKVRVDAVSKIKRESRADTQHDTIVKLIEAVLKIGDVRVFVDKLVDRLNNMESIGAKSLENQKRIARETENVYIPFASILRMPVLVEKLTRLTMKVLKGDLLEKFERLRDEKYNKMVAPNVGKIEKFLEGAGVKEGEYEVRIVPHGIDRYVAPLKTNYELLSMDDLKIRDRDSMHEIVILVKDPEKIDSFVQHLIYNDSRLSDAKGDTDVYLSGGDEYGGVGIHANSDEFGGPLSFRINSVDNEVHSKRGVLAGYVDKVPTEWLKELRSIIDKYKRGKISNVLDAAQCGLLMPRIHCKTPKNKPIELPAGATVVDFIAAIGGSDLSKNLLWLFDNAVAYNDDPELTVPDVDLGLFDEVPSGLKIKINTKDSLPADLPAMAPSYVNLCVTKGARSKILYGLRNPVSRGIVPGITEEEQKGKVIENGRKYLLELSRFYNFDYDKFVETLKAAATKSATQDEFFFRVGAGEINPILYLGDALQKMRANVLAQNPRAVNAMNSWTVEIEFEHVPGKLEECLVLLKDSKYNLGHHEPVGQRFSGDGKKYITFAMNIEVPGDHVTVYDFLLFVLKLKLEGFSGVKMSENIFKKFEDTPNVEFGDDMVLGDDRVFGDGVGI